MARLNDKPNKYKTPLHKALYMGCIENLKILIKHGANVHARDIGAAEFKHVTELKYYSSDKHDECQRFFDDHKMKTIIYYMIFGFQKIEIPHDIIRHELIPKCKEELIKDLNP